MLFGQPILAIDDFREMLPRQECIVVGCRSPTEQDSHCTLGSEVASREMLVVAIRTRRSFPDHETRPDHSFLIRRSHANQGWLVFKSPKEVSCLDSFQFHRIQISVTSTPSVSSSLDCFRTLRAVVHFAHFACFSYTARTDHTFPRSLILPLRPDLGVFRHASQVVSPEYISPIP